MDAITNTMGVVMFILLMVVLFGRPVDAVPIPDQTVAHRVQQLRQDRDTLLTQVAQLPPAGDPQLVERWRAAFERITTSRLESDALNRLILQQTVLAEAAQSAAATAEAHVQQLMARVKEVQEQAAAPRSEFVRVSRFQPDARRAVILALNTGKVSRPSVTRQTKEIPPPTEGAALGDAAHIRAALGGLLRDAPPTTHRVELVVWADSFAQAKQVEQTLLEMGYDTNPLPVAAGQALKPGTGGVQ
jgi:hypothetical protein